jgi:hypothetical protein
MAAFTAVDTAKIESQDHRATPAQRSGQPVNDFVMHGAAEERMRMAHQGGFVRWPVFGFFEQRLECSRRSIECVRLDAPRH